MGLILSSFRNDKIASRGQQRAVEVCAEAEGSIRSGSLAINRLAEPRTVKKVSGREWCSVTPQGISGGCIRYNAMDGANMRNRGDR